jgi:DNA-directed RNA polymerase alpha subunit
VTKQYRGADRLDVIDVFSIRTMSILKNMGVTTLGDLVAHTEKDVYSALNSGRKTLNEIKEFLSTQNLVLGVPFEEQMRQAEKKLDEDFLNNHIQPHDLEHSLREGHAHVPTMSISPLASMDELKLSAETAAYFHEKNAKTVLDVINSLSEMVYSRWLPTDSSQYSKPEYAYFQETKEALKQAGLNLDKTNTAHFTLMSVAQPTAEYDIGLSPLIKVKTLGFNGRVANSLKNNQIDTLGELLATSENELLRNPGFGRVSLTELQETLRKETGLVTGKPFYQQALEHHKRRTHSPAAPSIAEREVSPYPEPAPYPVDAPKSSKVEVLHDVARRHGYELSPGEIHYFDKPHDALAFGRDMAKKTGGLKGMEFGITLLEPVDGQYPVYVSAEVLEKSEKAPAKKHGDHGRQFTAALEAELNASPGHRTRG